MAQLTGGEVRPGSQSDCLSELLRLSVEDAIRKSEWPDGVAGVREHCELQVLTNGQLREYRRDLEGATDAGPRDHVRRLARDVASAEFHCARGGLQLTGDEVEEGRLNGPVRTDGGVTVAMLGLEAHVLDRAPAANPRAHGADLNQGLPGMHLLGWPC